MKKHHKTSQCGWCWKEFTSIKKSLKHLRKCKIKGVFNVINEAQKEHIKALKEQISDWADSLMMSDAAGETASDIMYGINEIAKEMKEAII